MGHESYESMLERLVESRGGEYAMYISHPSKLLERIEALDSILMALLERLRDGDR